MANRPKTRLRKKSAGASIIKFVRIEKVLIQPLKRDVGRLEAVSREVRVRLQIVSKTGVDSGDRAENSRELSVSNRCGIIRLDQKSRAIRKLAKHVI